MEIVAVAMKDVKAFGVDRFYVRFEPDVVYLFDVYADGRVEKVSPEAVPERFVTAAIEKFNASFRVEPPVSVASLEQLPKFLEMFEIVDDVTVRPKGKPQ